jgi:hypothetical protein
MTILEANDEGALHLPSELIGGAKPHTRFELEVVGDVLLLRPASKGRPFWEQATPSQRAQAFREWADVIRPPAPVQSHESLRRESIYD